MSKTKKHLLVTTAHRGVFAGYGVPTAAKTIELEECRMCVYWSADMKGVIGLATQGPSNNCRVGPAATKAIILDVTAVIETSKEAEAKWKTGLWS